MSCDRDEELITLEELKTECPCLYRKITDWGLDLKGVTQYTVKRYCRRCTD